MTNPSARDARLSAARAGLFRGWIETRQLFTDTASVIGTFVFPVMYAIGLLVMRGKTVPGTDFALGAMVLPSLLGMSIAFGGLAGPVSTIAMDREDGTMLRAKATPHGMLGYLIGKIVLFALTTFIGVILLVVPGIIVAGDLVLGPRAVLLLASIFIAGMMSTVPIAVALGSIMKSAAQSALMVLVVMLLAALSGIFYPITALPTWMQWVGQAFPFYWVGLGARSAMLPAEMAQAEIGQSWRMFEMFGVLGAWAVIGMLLAPGLLRRMARRQSGSTVAATRQRIMAKGY
jgi:ABC-2 type transport system permease protein